MNKNPKVFKSGKTVIRVHTPLAHMTDEERKVHFKEQLKKKNPVYMELFEVIHECYMKQNKEKPYFIYVN